jgi:DNA-binding transcriptional LysR family regulator
MGSSLGTVDLSIARAKRSAGNTISQTMNGPGYGYSHRAIVIANSSHSEQQRNHSMVRNKSGDLPRSLKTPAVDLQYLRYAIAAADCGSFRKAADTLLLRQSTISRCVRQLEHSVGTAIFKRSSGGIETTEAGRNLLRQARAILDQMSTLVAAAQTMGRGETGRLAIGFYTSLSTGNLRATLLDYSQRYPGLELIMVESSRTRLVSSLYEDTIDIAIMTSETAALNSRSLPLWSERILLALPQGHPLSASKNIYWTDIKDEPLLISRRDPGPEIYDLVIAKLASIAHRPRIIRQDVSRENLKHLISIGFGIGLTIESSLGADFPGVIHREIRDGTGPARLGYSANWREDNDKPTLASFLQLLRERYPSPPD